MNHEEFTALLSPFFTAEQIASLERYGYKSADENIREPDELWDELENGDQNEYLAFAGRDFVRNYLADCCDSDSPAENAVIIKREFGIDVSAETCADLMKFWSEHWNKWNE